MRKIIPSLVLTLLYLGLFAQIPSDNLLLYMPFNGNANDETGNGNTGTVHGSILTEDRFGNPNSAYYFDGINDYIDITNANLNTSYSSTINFWFIADDSWDSSTNHQIFFQSDVAGDNNGDFIIAFNRTNCGGTPTLNDGKINFELQADFVNNNSINCPAYGLTRVSTNTNSWSSQEWSMITAIVENEDIKIYVNGIIQNTQKCTSAVFRNGQNVTLGRYFHPQQFSVLNGTMDDISIHGRALTDEEITSIYEGTTDINSIYSNDAIYTFPNPTSGKLTIHAQTTNFKANLFDLTGRLVLSNLNVNNDISGLRNGTYLLIIQDKGNRSVYKILKQN